MIYTWGLSIPKPIKRFYSYGYVAVFIYITHPNRVHIQRLPNELLLVQIISGEVFQSK